MSKKKNRIRILLVFIILFPIVGLLITKYFSDTNLQMPKHYMVEKVLHIPDEDGNISTDTVYHRMRPFTMENQLGDTIRLKDIDNSIVLVNFFQTNDDSISQPVGKVLQKLLNSFAKSDTGLHVLSITTDPKEDSIPALLNYAFEHDVNHSVWWFLRGSLDSVKSMAHKDFNLTLKPHGKDHKLSSPTLVLLDRFQHVRGYYNALDSVDIKKCVHDLSLLMIEKEKLDGVER